MGSPTKELAQRVMAADEIASRIAAATRSNDDAVAVPGLEESGVEANAIPQPGDTYNNSATGKEFVVGSIVLPPSEWSPTKGKPVGDGTTHVLPREPSVVPMPPVKPTIGQPEAANSDDCGSHSIPAARFKPLPANDNYTTLRTILDAAFAHAATGKGKERHGSSGGRDLPFDKQPMIETTRLVGPGFPLGQAIKKAGEAAGMIERGQMDMAEAECLGAINYLAGAVAWMREQR